MTRSRVARKGVTPVSLLAAAALVVTAAGLLVPALVAVRAAADRAGCANHLRQIGAAALAFESARGQYPYTTQLKFGDATGQGWMPLLLPYLDTPDLARRYQLDHNWSDPANAAAVGTPVRGFVCPAAPNDTRFLTTEAYGPALWPYPRAATTDYLGVAGILVTLRGTEWVPPGLEPLGCGAIAGTGKGWRRTDFPDGLATTLLASEDAGRPYIWRTGRRSPTDHTPTILPERPNLSGAWAAQNVTGYRSFSADGTKQPGSCPVNCSNWIGGLYSFHAGGANAVFADGSVRFLSQTTTVHVVYALVSRAGGELVGLDDF